MRIFPKMGCLFLVSYFYHLRSFGIFTLISIFEYFNNLIRVAAFILRIIDFFYPLFRSWMPRETFRYAACGGGNTLLGLLIYSYVYNSVLKGAELVLDFYTFKPHVASLFSSFAVNFPVGFLLNKYVVFSQSTIRGRIQLFRYFMLFIFCLFLNYVLLKFFVEILLWNAILSQIITTSLIILVSYLSQKHFTFKVEKKEQDFPF